jgi:hypothetical protein
LLAHCAAQRFEQTFDAEMSGDRTALELNYS